MSSHQGYNRERRDFVPRGGGGFRGRGRGGFQNKPRRYWDNDDFLDRDKKNHGGRRYSRDNRSRSRSRSYSRSRSRSRSVSRSPRDRRRSRSNDYSARSSTENVPPQMVPTPVPVPQPVRNESSQWQPVAVAYPHHQYQAQANGGLGNDNSINIALQAQIQAEQIQKYQMQQTMADPSLTFGGYGYPPAFQSEVAPVPAPPAKNSESKKKKKGKKKKSRRRSSSSSSSDSSSDDGSRRRRKKRGSDDSSSSSSSEDDDKHTKEKEKAVQEAVPANRLTDEQRQALLTQHEGYKQKLEIIEREIVKLHMKEEELKRSRADIRLLEENLKLQAELKGRCKAVNVVLEKINNVLVADRAGAGKPAAPPPPKLSEPTKDARLSKKDLQDVEYVDSGVHWCRLCNVFPENVEQMLMHFHSQGHRDQVEQLGIDDKPWHKNHPSESEKTSSGSKKLPIRGMQFFSPVEGWYCRLCNAWMGDQHCASVHLKGLEHNSNYMTFLGDHPDWETKWSTDREKALSRVLGVGLGHNAERKSRFDTLTVNEGSIHVQMRNSVQADESQVGGFKEESKESKDGLDEWMGKPNKTPVDVLDTQKFAEIVRQRHGNAKKAEKAEVEPARVQQQVKEGKRDEPPGRELDRRRNERFELQITSRDNNRDRGAGTSDRAFRERDRDPPRRRTRSRSRSRDRGYHGRRRSRSRSRDRRDRDRSGRGKPDRDREPVKKQMPMIGKMPLYKRFGGGKEKSEPDRDKTTPEQRPDTAEASHHQVSEYDEQMQMEAAAVAYAYADEPSVMETPVTQHSTSDYQDQIAESLYVPVDTTPVEPVPPPDTDLKPPGEKEAPGGTNLPDDLQHALDIIYKGGGKPITIPPPGYPIAVPPPTMAGYGDYGAAFPNFMGYEPYQMSFEGYSSADMEEITVPGNVPVAEPLENKQPASESNTESKEPEPAEDDDEDDLAMLGIDMDDVAVVRK